MSSQVKRSITISGHRTSISLEELFWDSLKEIADQQDIPISQLVQKIDTMRSGHAETEDSALPSSGLSSAIRVYVLKFYKELAVSGNAPAEIRDVEG